MSNTGTEWAGQPVMQVAAIPGDVANKALRVAILTQRMDALKDQKKAAADALKEKLAATDDWGTAEEMRLAMKTATAATRREIADCMKRARKAVAGTVEAKTAGITAAQLASLKGLLAAEVSGLGQLELFGPQVGMGVQP